MKNFVFETGKIVGMADKSSWSQTHVFFPEDQEKQEKYGNLHACFALKPKQEGIDLASFGKEIVNRFHEIYFSSSENQVLERLKLSLRSLTTEFNDQVQMTVVAGVVLEKDRQLLGYFASADEAKVMVLRDGQLVEILAGLKGAVKSCSGRLQSNDLVILGTGQFFELVSLGSLKAALESLNPNSSIEALAPLVHARSQNNKTAAIIFKPLGYEKVGQEETQPVKVEERSYQAETVPVDREETIEQKLEPEPTKIIFKPKKAKIIPKIFLAVKNSPVVVKRLIHDLKNQPNIFIRDREKRNRAKRTTLTVAGVLIVLLIASVILGSRHRSVLKESQVSQDLFKEIEYQYDQAVSLEELNPLRSRSLLVEAKEKVLQAQAEIKLKQDQEKLQEIITKIETELERVAKEYKIENAQLFLDLKLVKDGFKGTSWGFADGFLQVLDPKLATILEINTSNKAAKVTAGGEQIKGVEQVGADEGVTYGIKNNELIAVDQKRGEVSARVSADDWGEIKDLFGFGASAYLLDISKGRIIKYSRNASGFANPVDYLKNPGLDFQDAQDFAIDGSVWVLFSDGTIVKYTKGVKDNFIAAGIVTEFKEPQNLYTDPELDNLYVLDRKNLRVVVLNKQTGEYQAQYTWPGIAGALDLFASEKDGKILLLTGERIYEISLRS